MYDYSAQIDVWSLGVVMVESAMNDFLLHELQTEKEFREHFRSFCDTRGDLSRLKALPFGTEQDWEIHDWDLVPKTAMTFLGPNAEALFRGTLRLNPEKRLSPRAVLELPFFSGRMPLHVWDKPVASAPARRLERHVLERLCSFPVRAGLAGSFQVRQRGCMALDRFLFAKRPAQGFPGS